MTPQKRSWPKWIFVVYLFLFGGSIPWYLPKGSAAKIWLGLPHWVVISLLATIGIAAFTAFVVSCYWRDRALDRTDEKEGTNSL